MIEAYVCLAALSLQILAMSVLCPARLVRYIRALAAGVPAERAAQLEPGVDWRATLERHLRRYRLANAAVVLLGAVLFGWLVVYLQRPDWSDGPVETLTGAYFMVQALPLGLLALMNLRFRELLPQLQDRKRSAILARRGLLDFVSPFTVGIAVLGYILFAAYVGYIAEHPFPGFQGAITLGCVTLVYAINACVVYWQLYRRKSNSFEPQADRIRSISLGVKAGVYASIALVVFLSLNFTLVLFDLQRWEPAAQSLYLSVAALLSFLGCTAPPRDRGSVDAGLVPRGG
jgi:hypothetical protein